MISRRSSSYTIAPPSPARRTFSSSSTHTTYPPYRIYSDLGSADPEDAMVFGNPLTDASDVMAEALSHLNSVVEHLRHEGENAAANAMARDVHSMLGTFNLTTAYWPLEKFAMKGCPVSRSTAEPTAAPTTQMSATTTTPSTTSTNTAGTGTTSTEGRGPTTWAAIAATDMAATNRLVKFHPSGGLKRTVGDAQEAGYKDHDPAHDRRCIWVNGWSRHRALSQITDRILSGALFSMVYVDAHQAVCIIFQHAASASAFMDENAQLVADEGVGLFGHGVDVMVGQPYAATADLQRMAPPTNERRRLTFARSQLFTNGMHEQRFRDDLTRLVGRENVELVWLFNTGNATAVFSSTVIARVVREEFLRLARISGPYHDVQVGFSHDPCERTVNLITQLGAPGSAAAPRDGSDSTRSASSARPDAPKWVQAPTGRVKRGTDPEGWQTVQRKR